VRILVLSPRQCYPVTSGAKLREYYLLRALGEAGELLLAGYRDAGTPEPEGEDIPFCRAFQFAEKPQAYGPRQVFGGLVGKWPISVLNYTSGTMVSAAQELAGDRTVDLIQLESIHMIRNAEILAAVGVQAPVVYNWHNIESELMRRFAESSASLARRAYATLTAGKLRAIEHQILRSAFGHIVCSEREREALSKIAPGARIAVIENGVDCDAFAPGAAEAAGAAKASGTAAADGNAKNAIVFVGSMDYYPNAEGAVWFAREIWPAIRERMPMLEFCVVGARPTDGVLALREIAGVTVTGTVPDVRPYYQRALAAVVPLRTGGGTRLKILEAMAAGTPVVSTALGAEGLRVEPGAHYLLAGGDGSTSWVEAIQKLQSNPAEGVALAERGLRRAREAYDWKSLGAALVDTYRGWLRTA
jgi:glycosyltransferase involved in cell wall biosynthesis